VRKSAEQKKDTLLTNCIQFFFALVSLNYYYCSALSEFENFLLCELVDLQNPHFTHVLNWPTHAIKSSHELVDNILIMKETFYNWVKK
jgi:hypothetical protein